VSPVADEPAGAAGTVVLLLFLLSLLQAGAMKANSAALPMAMLILL
jgi:hypothetical protein